MTSLGKPSCDQWLPSVEMERAAGFEVLRLLRSLRLARFLSPMLRRGSSATEASGSFASEHVEERGERERSKAVLFVLSGTSLDTPTAAVPIRLFLWGGIPPHTASFAMPTCPDI